MKDDELPISVGLRTAEADGTPVESRFTDPLALRRTYDHLTTEDEKEAERRAKLRKLYDGNVPYSPEAMRNSGLKHLTNINWLGLKGVIDNRADTLLKLSSDTANLIELLPKARELAGPDAARFARIISEEFSTMLRETGDVIPALAMMNTEADLYGLGPVTWTSSLDYKPVALERGQIRFIGSGPVQSSRHELVMFESTLQASYLFFLLDHPDVASEGGWDLAQIKKLIVDVFVNKLDTRAQPGVENNTTYIESNLSMIRQNRFVEEHQFETVNVIHAFFKEVAFPRKITHVIMPSTEQASFLFRKVNAYDTMDQCFMWFPYSVNRRYAREVRGLASYLFLIELANNRYKCRVLDLAFQYASIILTQQTASSQAQLSLMEQGPFTVVPKDMQIAQNNVKPDMQQVLATSQYIDSIGVNSVTGGDKGPVATTGVKLFQGSDRQTKEEVLLQQKLRSHKEEMLFIQRMSVLDKVFRETYRRVFVLVALIVAHDQTIAADYPEIVSFIERCNQRGVSTTALLESGQAFTVVTCRDLVLGSEGKVGVLTELLGNYGGNLDEAGRKNAQRDWIQLRLGVQSADRYLPEVSRDNSPSDQSSFAVLENNDLREGQEVEVGQDQLHWSHIPVHSRLLQEIVDVVAAPEDNGGGSANMDQANAERTLSNLQQAGKDPRQLLGILVAASKHVQAHLAIGGLQLGMKDQAKRVQAMLRDLRPTIKSLNLAVATQERVEQAQREKQEREMQDLRQRADQNELEKAKYDIDKKAEVARYKVDKDHEVALRRAGLEEQVAADAAERKNAESAADQTRRDAESDAKVERENRIARARENAASAVGRMNAVQQGTGAGQTTPAEIAGTAPANFNSL